MIYRTFRITNHPRAPRMVEVPHFAPKRFLEFVELCRVAGICLPTREIGIREWESASEWPVEHGARRRYWAGCGEKGVYWFTYPSDMGALTCYLDEQPEVTVPVTGEDCPGCRQMRREMEWKISENKK